MSEAERIAKGLDRLAKQDLKDLCDGIHRPSLDIYFLILAGLVDFRRRFWLFGERIVTPTRLGLKVRAILERTDRDT